MKNLFEQILRFKQLSGLINEADKYGCVEGDCQNGTGKFLYSSYGSYYEGEFKNGFPNGKGILYMKNKKYFDGRFVNNDLKYGKKFYYNGDEVSYFEEGEFVRHDLNGYGKRQYMGYGVENINPRNIHIEEGTFKNGVLEKGTIEYENGKKFTGTFEYVGDKVKFTSEDGLITTDDLDGYSISGKTPLNKKTTGFCVKGNCNNGEGEYLGPLGSYKGSFKNNLFNDLSGEATLDTNVSQNDFALENFDLTKNYHTHLFKYTGQFVNGEFDGKGRIEFSDGAIYEGDFNENKIAGMGTFTFKDGSVYQGKVSTEDIDGSKSKYTLDYGDGSIDDVIDYNSKNTVEKLKLDGDDVSYDDDDDDDFYDYTDLNIYFSETKGNPGVLKYVDKKKYPQIKGKKVKISLEYIGDKTIKKEGKIDTGFFQFGDVRIGRYNLTADGKGLNEFKTIVDIDEDTKELTILLKTSNMKENFLVDKIKKMLFESVDDIKVGDCFEYTGNVGETPNWYIKVTKIVDKENCLVDGIQETILDGQIEFSKNMEFSLSDLDQSIPENSRNWTLTTNENYLKIKKEYLDKVEKEGKKFVGTDYSNNSSLTIDVAKEDLPKTTNVDQETKKVDYSVGAEIPKLTNDKPKLTNDKTNVKNTNDDTKDNEKSTEKTKIKKCESSIEDFYNFYVMVYRGQQPLPKDTGDLERKRIYVEKCAASNYSNFNKKTKEYIKRLMSVAPRTSQTIKFKNYFEINPILPESKDIYSNSISNSIMRVLKEHSKNKNNITIENTIIKNRLDFIYKSSNNYDLKFNLLKESKELVKKGYNESVVNTYYKRLIK
jgi:hypothetical protein